MLAPNPLEEVHWRLGAIGSGEGCNTKTPQEAVNGFACATDQEWYDSLRQLLASPAERARQGAAARCTIVERYSVASNTANFLGLFH